MDDTLLFIPPCCVDKKLPKAVMQAPHRALTFYTHGDVTMEKFYRAVSYLLVDPHMMVLSMPICSNETFVFLAQCFERKWITSLVLSTRRGCAQMVDTYLSEFKDRVLYVRSTDVSEVCSHMVLYNKNQALYISGPMYEQPHHNDMSAYNMMFIPRYVLASNANDWSNPVRNILFPDMLRHRQENYRRMKDIKDMHLLRFLHDEFPPYKEDIETEARVQSCNERFSFDNV